jgi:4-amino-4-deoxy-L-arabinose transferase-like glycosyltransferase
MDRMDRTDGAEEQAAPAPSQQGAFVTDATAPTLPERGEPAATRRGELARDLLLIALLGAVVSFPFLGQEWNWDTREVRHAGIAAEMAADGEFLVPHNLGRPYIYKQPVLHVPVALLYRAFGGPSMLLARVPSALAGILGAWMLYGLGRLFCGRRVALWAAVIVLATPAWAVLSRTARPDMLFSVALLASVWGLAAGMAAAGKGKRAGIVFAGGVAGGLAALAKGPYGLVYPLLFSFVMAVLAPLERDRFRRPSVLECGCFALGLAVVPLAWGLPAYLRDGGEYLRLIFTQHNPGTSAHVRPFFYYLGPGLLRFLPWALLLPAAFWEAWRQRRQRPAAGAALPRMVAVIFLALSCVPSKRWHYLGPWYPLAALVVAAALVRREQKVRLARAAHIAVGCVLVGMPFYYGVFQPVIMARENRDRQFVHRVADIVSEDSIVFSFPGMVEELNFVGRERGKIPGCRLVLVTSPREQAAARPGDAEEPLPPAAGELGALIRSGLREGRPCFLAANGRNLRDSAAALAGLRRTTQFEMLIEKDPAKRLLPEGTWHLIRLE